MKKLSQDIQSPGWDFNPGLLEYRAGVFLLKHANEYQLLPNPWSTSLSSWSPHWTMFWANSIQLFFLHDKFYYYPIHIPLNFTWSKVKQDGSMWLSKYEGRVTSSVTKFTSFIEMSVGRKLLWGDTQAQTWVHYVCFSLQRKLTWNRYFI
jgi:hypothetical protein